MPVTICYACRMFFSFCVEEQFVFYFNLDQFPQIVNLKVAGRNVSITWLPAFKGECHVFEYLIYHRKVISEVNTGLWDVVHVSEYNATTTIYNLQLQTTIFNSNATGNMK